MEFNYLGIIIATIAQFICGAIWYSVFFGKLWGQMHGFDKLSKETQDKMMKGMGLIYGVQFLVTLISTVVLSIFITNLPGWNPYGMAALFWLGFILPAQVSDVLFGGTESKWVVKKIAVQAAGSLIFIEVAATVLSFI